MSCSSASKKVRSWLTHECSSFGNKDDVRMCNQISKMCGSEQSCWLWSVSPFYRSAPKMIYHRYWNNCKPARRRIAHPDSSSLLIFRSAIRFRCEAENPQRSFSRKMCLMAKAKYHDEEDKFGEANQFSVNSMFINIHFLVFSFLVLVCMISVL